MKFIIVSLLLIITGLLILSISQTGKFLGGQCTNSTRTTIESRLTLMCEKAYFDGQKDAICGDIRIKYDDSIKYYKWIKSPWLSGKPAIFIPSKNDK